ncbi:MAG TPA: DUF4167 domain-containing protein [Caulobacteraceae bacterium]|jgi:hypothetical protein
MRDFKGIKRQRNRNRNGGGGGGGGGKPQHNANRAFDSNGPDGVKVRGAAQHVYEKYQQLARDAHTAGDRVTAENHLQHAEHYFRVMRAMQPQRPLADIVGRDQFVSGYDIDFEDEGGQAEAADADAETIDGDAERADQRQGEDRGYRDARPREEWRGDDRFDRSRNDRGGERQDRPYQGQRDDRFREDRFRDDRARGGRDERQSFERQASERQGSERQGPERPRFERQDRGDSRPSPPHRAEDARPATNEPEEAPVLRADDGDVSHAPAFLQARASDTESVGETRRSRRRRSPRDGADVAPPETEDI